MHRNKVDGWWLMVCSLTFLALVEAFQRWQLGGTSLLQDVFAKDYRLYFAPAMKAADPYAVAGFYNPFWIFAGVWLAERFGSYAAAVWVSVNLCAFVFACVKLKMPLWLVMPFVVFAGGLLGAIVGNVEGIVALGLVVPAPFGIVLLMLKPQIGVAVTLYYVLSALVYRGWKDAVLYLAPVLVLFTVSLIFFGDWYQVFLDAARLSYNTLLFYPLGVPVGLALIVAGVARRNVGFALMAIPFVTPYMNHHTWAFPFMGVVLVLVKEVAFLREMALVRVMCERKAG